MKKSSIWRNQEEHKRAHEIVIHSVLEMERQESGSSSISLHSWGSDLAEERDEFHGFNNFARKLSEETASAPLLIQPEVLCKAKSQSYGFTPSCESVKILLSQRLPMSQHDKECSSKNTVSPPEPQIER